MIDASLKDQAILAALRQDWQTAIKLNLSLIEKDKKNTDAYNRLAYAYTRQGQMKKAKEAFAKVIAIDPYNTIAIKNIKKLAAAKKGISVGSTNEHISPILFLEEPGKTKVVECINTAPMGALSTLSSGQRVFLIPKKHSIEIRDASSIYIGALPDDLAFRLLKLIEKGNEYSVFIKGVSKNCVSVFIRETRRGKKLQHQPSFIGQTNYIPYQRDIRPEEKKQGTSDDEDVPPGEES